MALLDQTYPNAPLALAAVEVRYPFTAGLAGHDRIATLQSMLETVTPLADPGHEREFTLNTVAASPAPLDRQFLRFRSRDRSTAVTVTDVNVIIESANYPGYAEYRPILELVLNALMTERPPVGLQRVGMRYINEVRAPGVTQHDTDWGEWLETTLLAPAHFGQRMALPVRSWQGLVQFDHGMEGGLVLRYGPGQGQAINPDVVRRPPGPTDGHYFLLDLDSYWEASDDIPTFDPESVLKLCDRLHDPVKTVFESTLSEKLRAEVLRKDVSAE